MADTTTTAYGLTKPEVGASEDTWGTKINTDFDSLDTIINAIGGKTAAGTLSYADSAKLVTSATGIDVTGTVTADGLTVDNNANHTFTLRRDNSLSPFGSVDVQSISGSTAYYSGALEHYNGQWRIQTQATSTTRNPLNRATFDANGDISFYEDTGTTPKFFWDASAESLGIGTSSPSAPLHVAGDARIGAGTGDASLMGMVASGDNFKITTSSSIGTVSFDRNVGIGTSSPASLIHANNTSGDATIRITSSDTGYAQLFLGDQTSGSQGRLEYFNNNNSMGFYTSGTERMRIDSSGNLLVGTTTTDTTAAAGFTVQSDGQLFLSADSQHVATMTRLTNDGDILTFRRSAIGGAGLTTVGSIGTLTGDMYLGTGDTGLYFLDSSDAIIPANPSSPSVSNGIVNLGQPSYRFKDLYLSGGVYLGGTGSANHLDDYESGTWTPVYSVGTSGSVNMSTVTAGYYVKIGKMVQISFQISTESISSPTGTIEITGLPFAVSSQTDNRAGCAIGFAYRFATAFDNLRVGFINGESKMRLNVDATNATSTTKVVGSDFSTTNNGNYFYASGTYQTA